MRSIAGNRRLLFLSALATVTPCSVVGGTADDVAKLLPEVRTWEIRQTSPDASYEAAPATPTFEGDTGLFRIPAAYTIPFRHVSFAAFRENIARSPKDEDISTLGISIGYGLTSRLEASAKLGLQNRVDIDAPSQNGLVNDFPYHWDQAISPSQVWQTGLGDIVLGAKYKILDDRLGDGVALAVRPYVKIGIANASKGLGTGRTSLGINVSTSRSVQGFGTAHAVVGFQYNAQPTGFLIGNALRLGAGVSVPDRARLQIQAELLATWYTKDVTDNPFDVIVGPVLWFKSGVFVRAGLSWNLAFDGHGLDSSVRSYTGVQLSIGYHSGTLFRPMAPP